MSTKKELEEKIAGLESELAQFRSNDHQSSIINHKSIDIVYPNVVHLAQWEELKYSIRSIEKDLKNMDCRIWVVGDFPDWANEKLFHIPCEFTGRTPWIDILYKHLAVIDNPEIGEEYFWMNDDIYFVNPVQYADLCLNIAVNELDVAAKRMKGQTIWERDNLVILALLKKEGLPTWNYAVHPAKPTDGDTPPIGLDRRVRLDRTV